MSNMFSNNSKTTIPKSLSECTKPNATVDNLHSWSEKLEKWGKILFVVILILGVIVTVTEMIKTQELRQEYRHAMEEYVELPSEVEILFNKLLTWGFYALLEYCAYHVLALLISALAFITQSTNISANVALYVAANNPDTNKGSTQTQTAAKPTLSDKQSTNSTQTGNRPVFPPVRTTLEGPAFSATWECPHCLTQNKNEYGQCKKCGTYRSL